MAIFAFAPLVACLLGYGLEKLTSPNAKVKSLFGEAPASKLPRTRAGATIRVAVSVESSSKELDFGKGPHDNRPKLRQATPGGYTTLRDAIAHASDIRGAICE